MILWTIIRWMLAVVVILSCVDSDKHATVQGLGVKGHQEGDMWTETDTQDDHPQCKNHNSLCFKDDERICWCEYPNWQCEKDVLEGQGQIYDLPTAKCTKARLVKAASKGKQNSGGNVWGNSQSFTLPLFCNVLILLAHCTRNCYSVL